MRSFILIFLTVLIFMSYSGCRKYEEGPLISLRKSETRIYGKWDIIKYYINGNDSTNTYKKRYTDHIYFSKGSTNVWPQKAFCYNCYDYDTSCFQGAWFLISDKIHMTNDLYKQHNDSQMVFPFNANDTVIFEIKKLSYKKLNIESKINNYDFRLELKKKSLYY